MRKIKPEVKGVRVVYQGGSRSFFTCSIGEIGMLVEAIGLGHLPAATTVNGKPKFRLIYKEDSK